MRGDIDIRQRAWEGLRRHAHQILAGGYARLIPADYTQTKEPEITGRLCKAMSEFMAEDDAPRWIVHYAIRDDPKLNVHGLDGEHRPRIDIEVERVQRGPRPLFRFEAKRLGSGHPLSSYLGSEGMGAFLSGYYPICHPDAGMLGYLQKNEAHDWCEDLAEELNANPLNYRYIIAEGFILHPLATGLSTWRSAHSTEAGSPLAVWHTLLRFW